MAAVSTRSHIAQLGAANMESVPPALDPGNPAHLMSVCSAIQQSTQAQTNDIRCAAEASLKACEASAHFSDVLLAIVASDAPPEIRLGAVILLKKLVQGCWKSTRGAAARLLPADEKDRVRSMLTGPLPRQEVNETVALQLAVLTSKVS